LFAELKAKVGTYVLCKKNLLRLLDQVDFVIAGAEMEK
jgi:hypothetical protein